MKTDVVIPMVPGDDDCIELRLALRSIEKNLNGDVVVWLYGYAPDWVRNVNVTRMERKYYARFVTFRDTRRKIELAAANDLIGPRFIYTYDDIYFLHPIGIDDLRRPIARCDGRKGEEWWQGTSASKNWVACMGNTLEALRKEKLPMWSYETHLPRVYNREKIKSLEGSPMLLMATEPEAVQYATWYYNHFVTDPVLVKSLRNFKLVSGFDVPASILQTKMKSHAILNANKYRPEVIGLLKEMFKEKSRFEA